MNKIVEVLYMNYLENVAQTDGKLAAALRAVSGAVDAALEAGTLSCDILAEYEDAAARCAFYAGFWVALGMGSCGLAA